MHDVFVLTMCVRVCACVQLRAAVHLNHVGKAVVTVETVLRPVANVQSLQALQQVRKGRQA